MLKSKLFLRLTLLWIISLGAVNSEANSNGILYALSCEANGVVISRGASFHVINIQSDQMAFSISANTGKHLIEDVKFGNGVGCESPSTPIYLKLLNLNPHKTSEDTDAESLTLIIMREQRKVKITDNRPGIPLAEISCQSLSYICPGQPIPASRYIHFEIQ